ncbi:MAG: hypothetical protein KBD56_05055 [Candidatus Eisenbacteria bacterium]|nr:hypothetical protein [Candidatus Eisenbacteria bacterium]
MWTRASIAAAVVLLANWGACAATWADSIFAREGLGEWTEGYDARGMARGSTGIGVADPNNFTSMNPASTAFAVGTLGHAGLMSSIRWSSDGVNDARRATTSLNELGLHLDLPAGLGVRLIVQPATNAEYSLEQTIPTDAGGEGEDILREEGSRGLTMFQGAASWRGGRNWAVGASVGLISGTIVDEMSFRFSGAASDSGYVSGANRRELRFHARPFLGIGFLGRPTPRLSVGGFFSGASSPRVTETYRSLGEQEFVLRRTRVELPMGLGAGAACFVTSRWRMSADVVWRKWEDFTDERQRDEGALPASANASFRNTLRWGVGVERIADLRRDAGGVWNAIAWRAGFAWIPWYIVDAGGDSDKDGIDEWRVSAGAALPIQRDRGAIDLGIAYGRRGSLDGNGLKEDYLNATLTFTFARVLREY